MKMDIATYTITELDAVFFTGILLGMITVITFQLVWRVLDAFSFLISLWTNEELRDEVRGFIKAVGKYKK